MHTYKAGVSHLVSLVEYIPYNPISVFENIDLSSYQSQISLSDTYYNLELKLNLRD